MKKILAMTAWMIASCLFIASVDAGPENAVVSQQNDKQPAQKKPGLSRRNKAMIEQSEQSRTRREKMRSSVSGTMPKKGKLSRHNKARIEQTEQAKIRQKTIQSGVTNTK